LLNHPGMAAVEVRTGPAWAPAGPPAGATRPGLTREGRAANCGPLAVRARGGAQLRSMGGEGEGRGGT